MQTQREALNEALDNLRVGTSSAAWLRDHAESEEVRKLAHAVHYIGFGAQQIAIALTDRNKTKDL